MTDRRKAATAGAVVWSVAAGLLAWVFLGPQAAQSRDWLRSFWMYGTHRPVRLAIDSGAFELALSDPVFRSDRSGRWRQVGHIGRLDPAEVFWYESPAPPADARWIFYEAPQDLTHVWQMLLPEERRAAIENRLRIALQQHGAAIQAAVAPLIVESIRESLPIVQQGVADAIDRHRPELDAIAARYRQDVMQARLLPLIRTEVLPVVQRHAQPVAEEIGQELWNRASLWRFGWRYLYDTSPLPDRALVRSEWERFVTDEVIPVISAHEEDLIEAHRKIMADLAENAEIRQVLTEVGNDLLEDGQLRGFLLKVLREGVLENQQLRQRWQQIWSSPAARRALADAADRLEPTIRSIGDELFGTRDGGITPEFARVLRLSILDKDRRWIVVTDSMAGAPASAASTTRPVLEAAEAPAPFPLLVGATGEAVETRAVVETR